MCSSNKTGTHFGTRFDAPFDLFFYSLLTLTAMRFGDFIQEDLTLQHWYLLALENAKKKILACPTIRERGREPPSETAKKMCQICPVARHSPKNHEKVSGISRLSPRSAIPRCTSLQNLQKNVPNMPSCQASQGLSHAFLPVLRVDLWGGAFLTTAGTGQIYI